MNTIPTFDELVKENLKTNIKVRQAVALLDTKGTPEWDGQKWLNLPLEIRIAALELRREQIEMLIQNEFVGGDF